ncbi:ECF transporter S component [Thermotoga sp. KOL6]|uniref:ECF transporter S component n=1 Tax=Thermotoga sp. KOL6 TaxID=126741 RepID=UPI000C761F86|nr:ECF transporter S component [Thermotoga sp. KOL6]PLV58339.1 signal transduction histidine kinase LytS [Thermotoga sp. KOL6]
MKRLTYTAMWLAVGIALAYLFHLVNLGRMFLPLHLVAMLAGATSGAFVGGIVGAFLPLLSFLTMGMPPFPIFLFMIPEIFFYGFIPGIMKRSNIFLRLLIAILVGRLVYSISYYTIGLLIGIKLQPITSVILSFTTGIPGVILQFIVVPLVYRRLQLIFEKGGKENA